MGTKAEMRLGLIAKEERYGLTLRGWIALVVVGVMVLGLGKAMLYPFLAVNKPVGADVMVVEGWLPDYALEIVVAEFQKGDYELLVTTGGDLAKGSYLSKYGNFADLTAATLIATGFDKEKIISIPSPKVNKDRTYETALRLQQWLHKNKPSIDAIDIYSLGPHGRRTWLLFDLVLGGEIQVGIVSLEGRDYEADSWWRSSSGVRTMLNETIAYIYVRFFFYPH